MSRCVVEMAFVLPFTYVHVYADMFYKLDGIGMHFTGMTRTGSMIHTEDPNLYVGAPRRPLHEVVAPRGGTPLGLLHMGALHMGALHSGRHILLLSVVFFGC